VFPDVTAGMTTLMKAPEMYGVALTEGGDVVNVASTNVPTTPTDWLNILIEDWTAEKIMEVNDGKIPVTMEEIETVRAKLEANKVNVTG
jgi:enterochelin esterase-like enzyme